MDDHFKIKSLTEQIYEYLSEMIISGEIKPGEKLVENELCKRFRTSRGPIRESLKVLETEGLVVVEPRRGAYVRRLTPDDIKDAVVVRQNLEGLAVELAIPYIGADQIRELEESVKAMDVAAEQGDIESFTHYNIVFHNYLSRLARNNLLSKILENLWRLVWRRTAVVYFRSMENLPAVNEAHKEILEAIKDRDSKRARDLVEQHIKGIQPRLLRIMGY
jgi:DNA-binding GntR family transcriptional regulator